MNGPNNYDTDNDGLSDSWEVAEFGDLTKTAIGNDKDSIVTNIEWFSSPEFRGLVNMQSVSNKLTQRRRF